MCSKHQPSLSDSLIIKIIKIQIMKKSYISPVSFCICLDPKMPILNFPLSRGNADEGQFTKEYTFDDEEDIPTGGSIKNIWDEEW